MKEYNCEKCHAQYSEEIDRYGVNSKWCMGENVLLITKGLCGFCLKKTLVPLKTKNK